MDITTQQVAIVARLWQEHLDADFPSGLRGAEPVEGIDMVLLDLNIAGCVHTWLDNGGSLDAKRHRILRNCLADMDQVLPVLNKKEDLCYCERLRRMAQLVSDASPRLPK